MVAVAQRNASPVGMSLPAYLAETGAAAPRLQAAAETVAALATAAVEIAKLTAKGPLAGALGEATGAANADGDVQKALDVQANELVLSALHDAPVAYFASEEEDAILTLAPDAPVAVAVDPLDGSSNIDVNVSIGTIFSIFPTNPEGATASFFRPGEEQLAAGYFVYGPHTALVLTLGQGVDLFVLDPDDHEFRLARSGLTIPAAATEFAINASNSRHWFPPIRTFIDDCLEGAEGPRGKNFNMRWVASLVAETHRIFSRGGVFLYPADRRPGYEKGRLRLIYEAAPIAFLAEQAGGAATDGIERILLKVPGELHQRTPLVFGCAERVHLIVGYHVEPTLVRDTPPLFRERGLFSS
ncbi:class 1 fructose-bisphosphatase [Pelagibius marinus]|uniref:class 1 fructose-bisphosphatase n=1 Tax=Pelagibius marinus TaxID=2762760 RepID=UPI002AC32AA7|nr:class 1 fructose-bisphosphatase [Pelagibius marinus]